MPKLVWRVKLVAELRPGVMTETEVARIERDQQAGLAELGLNTDDGGDMRTPVSFGQRVSGIEDEDGATFVSVAALVVAVDKPEWCCGG